MGTRRGAAERSGAEGRACAQDARKAPRMAQDGLGAQDECLCPSPRPEPVLGHSGASGGGVEGHACEVVLWTRTPGLRRFAVGELGDGGSTPPRADGREGQAPKPVSSPAHQTSIFKPRPLSWPERHPFDATRIDDKGRWIAATSRFLVLVNELCRKYRKEFPSVKYGVTAMGGLRERLSLLQQFGGLPKSVESLNGVPAEKLEEAVEAFAHYFGLTGNAATGNLDGTPSAADLDPAPRKRRDLEVPW